MSGKTSHAPRAALVILDMISDFRFEDGARVARSAAAIVPRLARLKRQLKTHNVPVIYVNDETRDWNANRDGLVRQCLGDGSRGKSIVERLLPQEDDLFVFKPKHSGFYATPLHEILKQRGVNTLILTGTTAHQCVLFTAVDAYVRDYTLQVPRDCIAAMTSAQTRNALFIFQTALKADLAPSTTIARRFTSRKARSHEGKKLRAG
jgi:nicotinamidase-related amidase